MIPNAIEVERFIFNEKVRTAMRKKYGFENKHIIGHVGRFMTQKNHAFLIDVFEEVSKKDSQAMLVLLGDGELQEEIRKK